MHKSECLSKSGLSEQEFEIRLAEINEKIKFIGFSDYKRFLKKSLAAVSDSEDAHYIAVALLVKAPVWSNDSHIKQQSLAKVRTTKELVEELLMD